MWTPQYITPEILTVSEGNGGFGIECDWWSFGICVYEMAYGQLPFLAQNFTLTCAKIMNFKVGSVDEVKPGNTYINTYN